MVRDIDCSAYDCEFVALAQKLETRFFTMGGKLLKAFPDMAAVLTTDDSP